MDPEPETIRSTFSLLPLIIIDPDPDNWALLFWLDKFNSILPEPDNRLLKELYANV